MGIYLPNMKMPRKGEMLVIFPDGTSYVCFNGMRERLRQTTAVPVPAHGRLIDADALIAMHEQVCSRSMKFNLDLAPTIIPAEPAEEGKA